MMRSLIKAHDDYGRAMLADLTGRTPPEAACGSASSIHAGDGNGRQRAPEAILAVSESTATDARVALAAAAPLGDLSPTLVEIPEAGLLVQADAVWAAAERWVHAQLDAAAAVMAEGGAGLRLAAAEPWEEADGVYRARLIADRVDQGEPWEVLARRYVAVGKLDEAGDFYDLPRAQLVRAFPCDAACDDEGREEWCQTCGEIWDFSGDRPACPRARLVRAEDRP